MHKIKYLFLIFLFYFLPIQADLSYHAIVKGVKDDETLLALQENSTTFALQQNPPRSITALHYIARNDIPKMIQVMHAFGYFDASIEVEMQKSKELVEVSFLVDPGPRYSIKEFNLFLDCTSKKRLNDELSRKVLSLKLPTPAISSLILSAEEKMLSKFADNGYPFAKVEKREILVDTLTKNVILNFCIDIGKLAHFGATSIVGLTSVDPSFVIKKLGWDEGEVFEPIKIEETQIRLLKSDLFSSVLVTYSDSLDENDSLPLKIHISESKHKNFSIGGSYATVDGFGIDLGWQNRNFRGRGEQLILDGQIAQRTIFGLVTYKKIDFLKLDQDLVLQLKAFRERIRFVYLDFTYGAIARIDKRWIENSLFSYGIQNEYVDIKHSAHNGKFELLSFPLFVKYSTANDILNPTCGFTAIYCFTPYLNLIHHKTPFLNQIFTLKTYLPLVKSGKVVLATRLQLGSVLGPSIYHLPMTKLLFGGSDEDLRGYHYHTVSPTNHHKKPIGGRGAILLSLEPRFTLREKIGIVPFFDIGNVTKYEYPTVIGKWHKSIGIGFRYFSFFAPIRVDVARALDKVKHTPHFRIYISIGQTF